jgi:hypothetical protein
MYIEEIKCLCLALFLSKLIRSTKHDFVPTVTQSTVVPLNFVGNEDRGQIERRALLAVRVQKFDERVGRRQTLHHRVEETRVAQIVQA